MVATIGNNRTIQTLLALALLLQQVAAAAALKRNLAASGPADSLLGAAV